MDYRTEKDCIGEKEIPIDCLYGIHTIEHWIISVSAINVLTLI